MKRYEFGYNKYDNCVEPVPDSTGDWVSYEDFCEVVDVLLSMNHLKINERIFELEKRFPIIKGEFNDRLL